LLVPGFDAIAETLDLRERMAAADLVVTGEGTLDAESFEGKAVGGVVDLALEAGVPVLVVAGEVRADDLPELPPSVEIVSLVARFGRERATTDATGCVEQVVGTHLTAPAG
ncbi:MAG: glycerate kinase, partial [Actinomycetota bacterium]|nr:glycerate kinase [Actinomycetota bacterium]